ncbi:MAG: Stf0 family sulfotransferase [Planctomycetota bacterium]|nr:Stf0 family sulfotransferase [Planctomycetota bacterium]
MDRVRYVIVGLARSGTTATHAAIYGHPHICAMADELRVSPFFTSGVATFTVSGENQYERRIASDRIFDAITIYPPRAPDPEGKVLIAYNGTPDVPKAAEDVRANGLKVAIPNAEDARNLVDALQQYYPSVKIIHVRRSDWVAQFASLNRATKTGVWHTRDHASPATADESKMTLPLKPFEAYVDMAVEVERHLLSLRDSHAVHEVSYEAHVNGGDPRWVHPVFEFLGVDAMDPSWMRLTKTAPPLEDYVANVAELRALLAERAPDRG